MTTRELYNQHMDKYTDDTAVLSFTKYDHPSFQYIKNQLGMRAVHYLLEDIQAQHPDGSFDHTSYHSFWGACSLFRQILDENGIPGPDIPEEYRGMLRHIRRIYVDWGIREGYITYKEPTIPKRFDQLYRVVPNRFFSFRNWVWRVTTLPNRHRMKHKWDLWRAI